MPEAAGGTPPFYRSPTKRASLWAMLRRAMPDPVSVIPDAIYEDWSLKLPGRAAPVVIAHPDEVRRVLLDKGEIFGRNRQLSLMMRRAWGKGLAAAEGESWAAQRRAASPAFRPQAVEAATVAMADVARAAAARWQAGQRIELGAELRRIVAEIVMTTLLTGADDLDFDTLAADLPHLVREVATFGVLDLLPLSDAMINRLRGTGRSMEAARLRAIATRIADLRAAPPDARQDIPALLRGIGPLADNIFGFMPAGLETSALAAAWAVYLLALYPDWQEAVRAEALAGETQIARQVAQETLRLYPPGPLLARSAVAPTELGGFTMRPGQVVLIPIYAIHRHRKLWDRPDTFDPHALGLTATVTAPRSCRSAPGQGCASPPPSH